MEIRLKAEERAEKEDIMTRGKKIDFKGFRLVLRCGF